MKKEVFNVYSSMLGGFIAMGFETQEAAREFIKNCHCQIEKKTMTVSRGVR